MEQKINIKQLSFDELKKQILSFGEKSFRAKQIYEWLWKRHAASFDEMTNISKETRELLKTKFIIENLEIINIQKSSDNTYKLGFKLFDNEIIEGVLIPSMDRTTACISTQVGCPLKCTFCATGQLTYKRNLTFSEIYGQVVEINKLSEQKYKRGLSNIVIMGMGEPLLNYENVKKAIELMCSKDGFEYSPQRITLSTVGLIKELHILADDLIKYNVAISLHSADDLKRTAIMPVNKANPLSELSKALKYLHQKTKLRVTFEYLMLDNFNDSINDAKKLAEFCKAVPCKINLIEYNAVAGSKFHNSTQEKITAFKEFLENKNLIVNIRYSKGKDIDAACGQLAGKCKL